MISPTFTQNGVIITDGVFTLPSKIVGDASFTPVYPTSNSSGVISYSSSHPLVATVNASSGAITIVGAGSTTITMTQAAAGNYASRSVSGSLVVAPPPPPVILDTNGVTLKYTSSSIPSGQSNPYIVEVSGISYAVMSDSQDSKTKIRAYADNFWQPINHSAIMPFVANGTIIPFSRIVTTLMTDMSHLFGTFSTNSLFTTQDTYDDLSTWDVSNVTNMYMMFRRTQYGGFNPNIVNWDVSNVIDMTGMFQSSVFNRNISQWTVTNVTAYSYFTSMSSLPKTSIPEKFRDTYG